MNRFFSILTLTVMFLLLNSVGLAQKNKLGNAPFRVNLTSTEFGSATASSDGNGVFLKWQMKAEENNLGFNVYRVTSEKREMVNPNMISGGLFRNVSEITVDGVYSFFDPEGEIGQSYLIETIAINGQKIASNVVLAEYVSSLSSVAGSTSEDLIKLSKKTDYRIERNELFFPKELQAEIEQNALEPNLNNQRFVASQPGVKIGTKMEGIYRVSRTELQNAGFDVNQPSANWQLFMNGNEQAIIVGASGDFIEFYGQGIDTIESDTQIYFLINGAQPGKRIANGVRRRISASVISKSYDQTFYRADRVSYLNDLRNGDANNFFGNQVINTTGVNVNFTLSAIDQEVSQAALTVTLQSFTVAQHNIDVMINGVSVGQITGINRNSMSATFQIPTSVLIEGTNTLNLKVPSNAGDLSLLDSIKVSFARKYTASQDALSFYAKSNKQSEVTNFTSPQIRVFDTTSSDSPILLTNIAINNNNGSFGFTLPSNRSKRMFAVADSGVLPAASIVENTPSNLSTTNHNGKLIIISYKNWMSEAQAWANFRINDGYTVETVRVDDIFDEYNYGVVSAQSIRSFLQFAKDNWTTPPEYVLILGDASFDPRGYLTAPNVNYVPTRMFDTAYEETGSDEALSDFNDDGLAEIAIGRIPAQSGAEVSQALARVMTFEQTASQGFSRGALFVSDLPSGYDFAGMNQRIANQLPPGTPISFVNRADVDARTNLLTQLNLGRYLINYSGHGSTGLWAAVSFYSVNDVPGISNGTNYGIFTMLTCSNGYFLNPFADSLSEKMIKAPNGGGVVVWASSGKTTPDVQEILATRFYQKISEGTIIKMGDLIMDAKQNLVGGRDVRLSWALIGDPTLKVH